jgi:hypothetical protein
MLMILEVSDSGDWVTHPIGMMPGDRERPRTIPPHRRPTVLQPDVETAERECLRLAREHPGARFVVFKAVSAGITAKVPSHTTLGGKVVAEKDVATLVQFSADEDPDEIPF